CYCRGDHMIFKGSFFLVKSAGRKKYKNNLYKFRWLEYKKSKVNVQLGSVHISSEYQNYQQKRKTCRCIKPGPFLQKLHFLDHDRYHDGDDCRSRQNKKLSESRINIQPCDHDKSNGQKHTHMIQQQNRCIFVKNAIKHLHCKIVQKQCSKK